MRSECGLLNVPGPQRATLSTIQRFNVSTLVLVLATVFAATTLPLHAKLIDVNFTQNSSPGQGGPSPGPTMSGAAIFGSAGDQWNGINGISGSGIPLMYSDGTASSVKMTFSSGGGFNVFDYGGSTPFAGSADAALMETYLYNGGASQTITLSGLASNTLYDVVLYNAANISAVGRTTYFTINGHTLSSMWNGTGSTFIPGVDYVYFPAAVSDASGTLDVAYTGNGGLEGDVNGFQIQPSHLVITSLNSISNQIISFPTQKGFSYQLQYKTNLNDRIWSAMGNPVPGNDGYQIVKGLPVGTSRFYRVQMSTNAPLETLLRASGTTIVNAFNQPVQLRGLNLGGWFVMEPWMCPADSGGLPDTYSIIQELDSRFGVPVEQALIRSYQSYWITTADLDNIANAGFNCVRVPVWWGNFFPLANTTSSGWRSDAFTMLDWVVTNCATRGIYVVIDMHGVIGSQSTSDDTGQQNLNAYWTNSTDQSETAFMWAQIASHYNTNTAVAAYDLINEPIGAPNTTAVWTAYNSLYNRIRTVDTNHIIMMEGTFGSWNWSMLPAPSMYGWTNVVYSMHEYEYGGDVAQIEAGSDNQVYQFENNLSWNVPDYVGEWNDMGQGAACYQYSINDYDHAGISWSMWSYKNSQGLVPDGWGWYDPTNWPPTPNVSKDSTSAIVNDWQQWETTNSFGVNSTVGL
ncbi:MAG TPA: cellulase family glycosylhydrolase [Verrucomicrobiae bacterium]|nr:cellulase family glycosylhydrolase [Verrucomicrobiae bacterium]